MTTRGRPPRRAAGEHRRRRIQLFVSDAELELLQQAAEKYTGGEAATIPANQRMPALIRRAALARARRILK